jgi:hypothetical protein
VGTPARVVRSLDGDVEIADDEMQSEILEAVRGEAELLDAVTAGFRRER